MYDHDCTNKLATKRKSSELLWDYIETSDKFLLPVWSEAFWHSADGLELKDLMKLQRENVNVCEPQENLHLLSFLWSQLISEFLR